MNVMPASRMGSCRRTLQTKNKLHFDTRYGKKQKEQVVLAIWKTFKKKKSFFFSSFCLSRKKWIIDHDQIITSCNIRCENRLQCQCGSPFGRLRVQAEIQSALMVYILGDPLHDIYLELQIQGMPFNYKLLVKYAFETIGWAKQNQCLISSILKQKC